MDSALMAPHRISAKYFVTDASTVDLESLIPVFHGWIRRAAVPGMLIDVADYGHMADGPGVILVGHDVEYGLDITGGRAGLVHRRKRGLTGDVAADVATVLRETLLACQTLSRDVKDAIGFVTNEALLSFPDRLAAPNSEASFAALREPLNATVSALYGDADITLARDTADDRDCLTIRITSPNAPDIDALVQRGLAAAT